MRPLVKLSGYGNQSFDFIPYSDSTGVSSRENRRKADIGYGNRADYETWYRANARIASGERVTSIAAYNRVEMLGRSRTNEPAAYDAMRENDQLMELSGVSAATFAAGVKKIPMNPSSTIAMGMTAAGIEERILDESSSVNPAIPNAIT